MHHSSWRFVSRALAIILALTWIGQDVRSQDIRSPTGSIADETVDQMADAYIALEAIRTKANDELKDADDQEDARAIRNQAQDAMIQAIQRTGLKLRDFNRLSQLAALDPALADRIRMRMLEREPI